MKEPQFVPRRRQKPLAVVSGSHLESVYLGQIRETTGLTVFYIQCVFLTNPLTDSCLKDSNQVSNFKSSFIFLAHHAPVV